MNMGIAFNQTNASADLDGKVIYVISASDIQVVNMGLANNRGNAIAMRDGEAYSAIKIWIIAQITNPARTARLALMVKDHIHVRVALDLKEKIAI